MLICQMILTSNTPFAGTIDVLAGLCGLPGYRDSGEGGPVLFDSPRGLCQRPNGDIIVIDNKNALLRRVNRTGERSAAVKTHIMEHTLGSSEIWTLVLIQSFYMAEVREYLGSYLVGCST